MSLEWVGVPPAPPIKNPYMEYMILFPSIYWTPSPPYLIIPISPPPLRMRGANWRRALIRKKCKQKELIGEGC